MDSQNILELRAQWPGVFFSTEVGPGTEIGPHVLFDKGASIDLSHGPKILGASHIKRNARLSGNLIIIDSTVDGVVTNSQIYGTSICTGATVSGSYLARCIIRAKAQYDGVRSGAVPQIYDAGLSDTIIWPGDYDQWLPNGVTKRLDVLWSYMGPYCAFDIYPHPTNMRGFVTAPRRRQAGPMLPGMDNRRQAFISVSLSRWFETSGATSTQARSWATSTGMEATSVSAPFQRSEMRRSVVHTPVRLGDGYYNSEPPDELVDSILSHTLIHQAVIAKSGHTFDLQVLTEWLRHHDRDPVTGESQGLDYLVPNLALQRQIEQWKTEHRIYAVDDAE